MLSPTNIRLTIRPSSGSFNQRLKIKVFWFFSSEKNKTLGNNILDSVKATSQCGAGSAPPYSSTPSPGWPGCPWKAASLSPTTTQGIFLGNSFHAGANFVASTEFAFVWKICQSLSAASRSSGLTTVYVIPGSIASDTDGSVDFKIKLAGIPASVKAIAISEANSRGSGRLIDVTHTGLRWLAFKSITTCCQFIKEDLGKTARSTRSSRIRSLAVRRRSPNKRFSVIAASVFCSATILPLTAFVLNCVSNSNASATTSNRAAADPPSLVHHEPSLCQNSFTCKYSARQQIMTEANATYPASSQNDSEYSRSARVAVIMSRYAEYEDFMGDLSEALIVLLLAGACLHWLVRRR